MKTNLCIVLILFCLVFPLFSQEATPAPSSQIGDVNGDNVINPADALIIIQYLVGFAYITEDTADVNRDQSIDVVDALCIMQYIEGTISSFPAPTVPPVPLVTFPPGTGHISFAQMTPSPYIPLPLNGPGLVYNPGNPETLIRTVPYYRQVLVNSGDQRMAGFYFTVQFPYSLLQIDTGIGQGGITSEINNLSARVVNASSGSVIIAAVDSQVQGPGTDLIPFGINFTPVGTGAGTISIFPNQLVNELGQPIGSPAGETIPFTSYKYYIGDVNIDGSIDIIDALSIAQWYIGWNDPRWCNDLMDVNNSEKGDIVDALLIAQFYVGLIDTFPR